MRQTIAVVEVRKRTWAICCEWGAERASMRLEELTVAAVGAAWRDQLSDRRKRVTQGGRRRGRTSGGQQGGQSKQRRRWSLMLRRMLTASAMSVPHSRVAAAVGLRVTEWSYNKGYGRDEITRRAMTEHARIRSAG